MYYIPNLDVGNVRNIHTGSDYDFMILNDKIPHSKNSQDFILLVE